jgi:hypothetical protein
MDAQSVRRAADSERLRALSAASGGKISVLDQADRNRYIVDLRYFSVGSRAYPRERQPMTRIHIELSARYPFQPPVATVTSPIFHPNVFASGLVCLGAKWLPSEGMDLFVHRLARLITFDPLLLNIQSPANGEAMQWYTRTAREHPSAFPTDRVDIAIGQPAKPSVKWGESIDRVVVECPRCAAKLRVPAGKRGTLACPKCAHAFEAST